MLLTKAYIETYSKPLRTVVISKIGRAIYDRIRWKCLCLFLAYMVNGLSTIKPKIDDSENKRVL